MKKTLIAIAALAATGAFAQSSMTISGMIDAGLAVTTAPNAVVTRNVQSTTASRLRFVGAQDLGAGMKGNFWFEMQPSVTDGATNTTNLFNRGAWAGISSPTWGEVRLGRMGTNSVAAVVNADIQQGGAFYGFSGGGLLFNGMGAAGTQGAAWFAANPTRGGTAGQASSTSADSTRYTRAIRYSTPTLLNGLTIAATNAFGTSGGNAGGGSQGIDATYAAGPLRAVVAYQKAGAETGADATGSLMTSSINYDLGYAILGGSVQSEKAAGTGILFNSGKSYGLVAMVPMGAARPYVKLGNHSYDTMGTNAKMFNIGSTYSLSKTTLLYADYAKNSATATGVTTGATAATSPRIMVLGMQVNF
jgi:predicted porin